jgi:hypothetical protein
MAVLRELLQSRQVAMRLGGIKSSSLIEGQDPAEEEVLCHWEFLQNLNKFYAPKLN